MKFSSTHKVLTFLVAIISAAPVEIPETRNSGASTAV